MRITRLDIAATIYTLIVLCTASSTEQQCTTYDHLNCEGEAGSGAAVLVIFKTVMDVKAITVMHMDRRLRLSSIKLIGNSGDNIGYGTCRCNAVAVKFNVTCDSDYDLNDVNNDKKKDGKTQATRVCRYSFKGSGVRTLLLTGETAGGEGGQGFCVMQLHETKDAGLLTIATICDQSNTRHNNKDYDKDYDDYDEDKMHKNTPAPPPPPPPTIDRTNEPLQVPLNIDIKHDAMLSVLVDHTATVRTLADSNRPPRREHNNKTTSIHSASGMSEKLTIQQNESISINGSSIGLNSTEDDGGETDKKDRDVNQNPIGLIFAIYLMGLMTIVTVVAVFLHACKSEHKKAMERQVQYILAGKGYCSDCSKTVSSRVGGWTNKSVHRIQSSTGRIGALLRGNKQLQLPLPTKKSQQDNKLKFKNEAKAKADYKIAVAVAEKSKESGHVDSKRTSVGTYSNQSSKTYEQSMSEALANAMKSLASNKSKKRHSVISEYPENSSTVMKSDYSGSNGEAETSIDARKQLVINNKITHNTQLKKGEFYPQSFPTKPVTLDHRKVPIKPISPQIPLKAYPMRPISPLGRPVSPSKRSRSPPRHHKSPTRHSDSSPAHSNSSPAHSKSPPMHAKSPPMHAKSPRKHPKSSRRQSISPPRHHKLEHSRSPVKYPIPLHKRPMSPQRRHISPIRHHKSPTRHPASPHKQPIPPHRQPISPHKHPIPPQKQPISSRKSPKPHHRHSISPSLHSLSPPRRPISPFRRPISPHMIPHPMLPPFPYGPPSPRFHGYWNPDQNDQPALHYAPFPNFRHEMPRGMPLPNSQYLRSPIIEQVPKHTHHPKNSKSKKKKK